MKKIIKKSRNVFFKYFLNVFYVNLSSGVFRKSCVKHETLQKMHDANATSVANLAILLLNLATFQTTLATFFSKST